MIFILYKDKLGMFRWYLEAGNGKKIADSGEGYINKADCVHAIGLVKTAANAPVHDKS
jgi:uncharacterized protein